jgi:hypothetical protein
MGQAESSESTLPLLEVGLTPKPTESAVPSRTNSKGIELLRDSQTKVSPKEKLVSLYKQTYIKFCSNGELKDFTPEILNALHELGQYMVMVDFEAWVDLLDMPLTDSKQKFNNIKKMDFVFELMFTILSDSSHDLELNGHSIGSKILYTINLPFFDGDRNIGVSCINNGIFMRLLRRLTCENFIPVAKSIGYLLRKYPTNTFTRQIMSWIKLSPYCSDIDLCKCILDYITKDITGPRYSPGNCQLIHTDFFSRIFKYKFESEELFEEVFDVCLKTFNLANTDSILQILLDFPDDQHANFDLNIRIFNKLREKVDFTKTNVRVHKLKRNLCESPKFVEFVVKLGYSKCELIKYAINFKFYDFFKAITEHDLRPMPENPDPSPFSFKPLILDFVRVDGNKCIDFFIAHVKIMSSSNINELIHVAINLSTTTESDIEKFLLELENRGMITSSEFFVCTQNAFNRFGELLSKTYVNIRIAD